MAATRRGRPAAAAAAVAAEEAGPCSGGRGGATAVAVAAVGRQNCSGTQGVILTGCRCPKDVVPTAGIRPAWTDPKSQLF